MVTLSDRGQLMRLRRLLIRLHGSASSIEIGYSNYIGLFSSHDEMVQNLLSDGLIEVVGGEYAITSKGREVALPSDNDKHKALRYLLISIIEKDYLMRDEYALLFASATEAHLSLEQSGYIKPFGVNERGVKRKVAQCREFLRARGFSTDGSKSDLVARIIVQCKQSEVFDFFRPALYYWLTPFGRSVVKRSWENESFAEGDVSAGDDGRIINAYNRVRKLRGLPPIGTWKNEALLFGVVQSLFPFDEVLHHYRPDWLDGLELDVYVASANIGFEYQGVQHYEPQEHWGGRDALARQKRRDAKKAMLCAENGTRLIEVRYDEAVTEEVVRRKLGGDFYASL